MTTLDDKTVDDLVERFIRSATAMQAPDGLQAKVMMGIGQRHMLVDINQGRVSVQRTFSLMTACDLLVEGQAQAWEELWKQEPEPGKHDILAQTKRNAIRIEGQLQVLMAYLQFFRELLTSPRPALQKHSPAVGEHPLGEIEPIEGRYISFMIRGERSRVYFEQAGQGIPLVCLHTAGADCRQYRHLMCDEDITSRFRVIAFDMPAHGKSYPLPSDYEQGYQLTTERYVQTILAFCKAMKLHRPVLMGCSIGGRIVLELARAHAEQFSALIGLESADFQQPWYDTSWLYKGNVHGGEVCAALVAGLMAPHSPIQYQRETLWQYKQSGPGVFKGDLYFYRQDADLRGKLGNVRTDTCPLYLLTGEYDFSCTPEDSERTARSIPGTYYRKMTKAGHFPMSENPSEFRSFIMPVLHDIHERLTTDRNN